MLLPTVVAGSGTLVTRHTNVAYAELRKSQRLNIPHSSLLFIFLFLIAADLFLIVVKC